MIVQCSDLFLALRRRSWQVQGRRKEGLIRVLERPPSFPPPSLDPGTGFPELDPGLEPYTSAVTSWPITTIATTTSTNVRSWLLNAHSGKEN